jgi:hypothetical protein
MLESDDPAVRGRTLCGFDDLEPGHGILGCHRRRRLPAEHRHEVTVEALVSAGLAAHRPLVSAVTQDPPAFRRLLPPTGSDAAIPAAQSCLLPIGMLFHECRPLPEYPQARAAVSRHGTRPEVGTHSVGMRKREKHVVVCRGACPPAIQLRVNLANGTEERHGLIDEVAAEVIEQTTSLLHRTALAPTALQLGPPSLEAGLEALDTSEHSFPDESAERQVLTVPTTVVIGRHR